MNTPYQGEDVLGLGAFLCVEQQGFGFRPTLESVQRLAPKVGQMGDGADAATFDVGGGRGYLVGNLQGHARVPLGYCKLGTRLPKRFLAYRLQRQCSGEGGVKE